MECEPVNLSILLYHVTWWIKLSKSRVAQSLSWGVEMFCSHTCCNDRLKATLGDEIVVAEVRLEDDHHLIWLALQCSGRSLITTESITGAASLRQFTAWPTSYTFSIHFTPFFYIHFMSSVIYSYHDKRRQKGNERIGEDTSCTCTKWQHFSAWNDVNIVC